MGSSRYSLSFNGSSGAISAPIDLSAHTCITLSFWLKKSSYPGGLALEFTSNWNSNAGAFIVALDDATNITFGVSRSGGYWFDTFAHPSTGAWHHILLVLDRGINGVSNPVLKAYVDGSLASTSNGTHNTGSFGAFANSTLYFASRAVSSVFDTGLYDDVAIFRGDKSSSAASLAAGTIDPASLSPLALWRFEEGIGLTAADTSGFTNNGVISSSVAWSSDVPTALRVADSYTNAIPSTATSFVDPACPINWDHPLNNGLVADFTITPNSGWRGGKLIDLVALKKGSPTASPTWGGRLVPGGFGSIKFNGSTQNFLVPSATSLNFGSTNSFTVALWFKINGEVDPGSNGNLVTKGSSDSGHAGYEIYRRRSTAGSSPNTFQAFMTDGTNTANPIGSTDISSGVWFGVMVVDRTTQTAQLYLNGKADGSSVSISSLGSLSNSDSLGIASSSVSSRFANATIDGVQIYNRALSPAQVAALYKETKTGNLNRLNFFKTGAFGTTLPRTTSTGLALSLSNKYQDLVDPSCPINWDHPLNVGLSADYTITPNPGWRGGLLRDLVRGNKNPHDGTIGGRLAWVGNTGRKGGYGALQLAADSATQGASISSTVGDFGTGSGTVALWYRPVAWNTSVKWIAYHGTDTPFGSVQPGWAIKQWGGDGLEWVVHDGTSQAVISKNLSGLTDNAWHFVVGVIDRNASVVALYVNGVLVTTTSISGFGTLTGAGKCNLLGTDFNDNVKASWADGFQVYNRALNASEVAALYQETRTGNQNRFNWVKSGEGIALSEDTLVRYYSSLKLDADFVDPACPLNWSHPLNRGLSLDTTIIPNTGWRGGLAIRDLVRGGKNSHNGTLTNGPTWKGNSGRPGGYGAIEFDGSDDYINGNTDAVSLGFGGASSAFTIGLWFNTTISNGARGDVFSLKESGGTDFGIILNRTSPPDITVYINGDICSATRPTGWVHAAVTRIGSAVTLYINGVSAATGTTTGSMNIGTPALNIGRNTGASFYFPGKVDGVNIYPNRCLSAQEVTALYKETRDGNPTRLNWVRRAVAISYPRSPILDGLAPVTGNLDTVDPACPVKWDHPLNRCLVADWTITPNTGWRGGLTFRDLVCGGKNQHNGTLINGPSWAGALPNSGGFGSVVFDGTNDYISIANASAVQMGNGPFTVSADVVLTSKAASGALASQWGDSTNRGWLLFYDAGADRFCFFLRDAGNSDVLRLNADTIGSPVVGVRYFVSASYTSGGACTIVVNGKSNTGTSSGTAATSTATVRLGASAETGEAGGNFLSGRLGSVSLWKGRTFTLADHRALYDEARLGNRERFNWIKPKTNTVSYNYAPTYIVNINTNSSWNITASGSLTAVTALIQCLWNDYQRINKNTICTWNDIVRVTKTNNSTWNVRAVVGLNPKTCTWINNYLVNYAKNSTWNEQFTINKNKNSIWIDNLFINNYPHFNWNDLSRVSKNSNSTWNNLLRVSYTFKCTWNELYTIVKKNNCNWYDLITALINKHCNWNISDAGLVAVLMYLHSNWNEQFTVKKQNNSTWNEKYTVKINDPSTWYDLTYINKKNTETWNESLKIDKKSNENWNEKLNINIVKNFNWNDYFIVNKYLANSWNDYQLVVKKVNSNYNEVTRIANIIHETWGNKSIVGLKKSANWYDLSSINNRSNSTWDDALGLAVIVYSLSCWNNLSAVNKKTDSSWNIIGLLLYTLILQETLSSAFTIEEVLTMYQQIEEML